MFHVTAAQVMDGIVVALLLAWLVICLAMTVRASTPSEALEADA